MEEEAMGDLDQNESFSDVVIGDIDVKEVTAMVQGREVIKYDLSSVKGVPADEIKHKQLRSICAMLGVKRYKNKPKEIMRELIAAKKVNEAIYDGVFGDPSAGEGKTVKDTQCPFRLLNVLFSDEFVERFSCLGDASTRTELDQGIGKDQVFW